ncbi:MAG: DUF3696 domain-containing protein [Candidatus Poribacteria bacterium]|nr:DUF3696 domain-containing protein [Candidatus Poribacteria bacterium]
MITELRARNFKSWQDTGPLRFSPLTGLFGENSSGKTSILQVLLMLQQTVKGNDSNLPLNFGKSNFDTVIHRHDKNLSLGFSVSWKLPKTIKILGDLVNSLSFSTSILEKYRSVMVERFCYSTNHNDFEIGWTERGYRYRPNVIDEKADVYKCYGVVSPVGPLEEFKPLSEEFEDLFSRIRHLGPLREYPQHSYTWEGDYPQDVGLYGEKMIPALLSSRIRQRRIEVQILKWLQRLDLIDSFNIPPVTDEGKNYECLVKQYKDGPEVPLTDVGFGVSQVLPVLTQCFCVPENSILILEQPEAHLHPKVQSDLADVLIDVVKNRNVQIILESHSALLLHRLQRRIAEEQIAADDTALYFCQINDGTSEIEQLDVDEYGNILNWPQDFFGDDIGDLVEKTKVEMQRRKVME